jgi:hypothetical protein
MVQAGYQTAGLAETGLRPRKFNNLRKNKLARTRTRKPEKINLGQILTENGLIFNLIAPPALARGFLPGIAPLFAGSGEPWKDVHAPMGAGLPGSPQPP